MSEINHQKMDENQLNEGLAKNSASQNEIEAIIRKDDRYNAERAHIFNTFQGDHYKDTHFTLKSEQDLYSQPENAIELIHKLSKLGLSSSEQNIALTLICNANMPRPEISDNKSFDVRLDNQKAYESAMKALKNKSDLRQYLNDPKAMISAQKALNIFEYFLSLEKGSDLGLKQETITSTAESSELNNDELQNKEYEVFDAEIRAVLPRAFDVVAEHFNQLELSNSQLSRPSLPITVERIQDLRRPDIAPSIIKLIPHLNLSDYDKVYLLGYIAQYNPIKSDDLTKQTDFRTESIKRHSGESETSETFRLAINSIRTFAQKPSETSQKYSISNKAYNDRKQSHDLATSILDKLYTTSSIDMRLLGVKLTQFGVFPPEQIQKIYVPLTEYFRENNTVYDEERWKLFMSFIQENDCEIYYSKMVAGNKIVDFDVEELLTKLSENITRNQSNQTAIPLTLPYLIAVFTKKQPDGSVVKHAWGERFLTNNAGYIVDGSQHDWRDIFSRSRTEARRTKTAERIVHDSKGKWRSQIPASLARLGISLSPQSTPKPHRFIQLP